MIQFNNIEELMALAEEKQVPLHDIVIAREMHDSQRTREAIWQQMAANWQVMQAAIKRGLNNEERSVSGLTGGDARRLVSFDGQGYLGRQAMFAVACAVGISEVNAVMGRIVACPTAGSCGIVPAALYAAQQQKKFSDEAIIGALFTAAGIGMVIAQNACIAGAAGGCQAECGSAAGMAAGALVELAGGAPKQIGHAVALAIKNLLGLVCDPVAGLVEVPCVKRNGFATMVAMTAADMSLAGVQSVIPVDEVIAAMAQIGRALPHSLRETSEGGLAMTPTGQRLAAEIYPH